MYIFYRNKAFDMAGGVLNAMPWLRYIFPNWTNYNLIKNLNSEMALYFEVRIYYYPISILCLKCFFICPLSKQCRVREKNCHPNNFLPPDIRCMN